MKQFKKLVTGLTFLTLSATAMSEKPEISFAATKINDAIVMLSGVGGFAGGNMALLMGNDGVVLIDNSMPPMLDKLNASIAKVTQNKNVDFLINTHIHGDHIGNNGAMKKLGARIIAHKNLREGLIKKLDDKTTKEDLPIITLSGDMSFHLNGEEAHVIHSEKAHTDGDLFIHFENANVIHTGDILFNGLFPYIDLENGGSIEGYIAAQHKILSLSNKDTIIIPGHGPLANIDDLKASVMMLESAKDSIQALVKAGKTEDQIVSLKPLGKYHEKWNWGFITTEKMTRQLYQGLANKHHHTQEQKKDHKH